MNNLLNKKKSDMNEISFLIIAICIIIIGVITLMFASMNELQTAAEDQTDRYVQDVSIGVVQTVDTRIDSIMKNMYSLIDSIERMSDDDKWEFLRRKAKLYEFVSIGIIDLDGNGMFTDGSEKDCRDYSAFSDALDGKDSVCKITNTKNLLYTSPIYQDGEIVAVMAGIKSEKVMQDLLITDSFEGEAMSCIIDKDGNLIVAAKEKEIFLDVEEYFLLDDDDVEKLAREISEEIHAGKSGKKEIVSNNTNILFRYDLLNSEGLVLITIVPSDFITGLTEEFVGKIFAITMLTIFLLVTVLIISVTIQKKSQKKLETFAFVDSITQGKNNIYFEMLAEEKIKSSPPNTYVLVTLNVRKFKLINDLFGKESGDRLLKYILNIIQQHISSDELTARIHADIFNILLKNDDQQHLLKRIYDIFKHVNSFNEGKKRRYHIGFNSGIYIIDDPKLALTTIQSRANVASESTENDYRDSCTFYNEEELKKLVSEKEITNTMVAALENHEFTVYLQLKLDLKNKTAVGAEALVRWKSGAGEIIYPSDFIPVFEKNGFICNLDLYVFEEVCRIIEGWKKEGRENLTVSVNLSRQHLKTPNFFQSFLDIFCRYDISPSSLEFELTETVLFDDEKIISDLIQTIHREGFTCSLDDFGAGYTSLNLLKNMNIDCLKLDRKFFYPVDQLERSKIIIV
jgi:diguanylate cyclase (GGDEF)-like protein